jgi:hypothetical protein
MTDRWETFAVIPEGGLIENLSPLVQGEKFPGSLSEVRNFEPSPVGGYRRIRGYTKFDAAKPTGTGKIQAVFVFLTEVLALRDDIWYKSSGTGWTAIHTLASAAGATFATRYNWSGTDNIIICDSVNPPLHYDGTTLTDMIATNTVNGTVISTASANNIIGAQAVQEFHEHMFYSVGEYIRFSDVNNEGLVDGSAGSGEFITGSIKGGLAPWRKELYCFGTDRIGKITGNNSTDFKYDNVTAKVGTVDPSTIQEVDGNVYFMAFDGVRNISGTTRNEDIELGSLTRNIPNTMETLSFRRVAREVHAVSIRDTGQYRLFVGNSAAEDFEGEGILGGLRLNSNKELTLEWFNIRGINASCSDSGLNESTEVIAHGGYDGYVYQQEDGDDFNGAAVDAFLQFPYWTMGIPEIRKTMYKGKFYLQSASLIDPTVAYQYDYNITGTLQPASQSLSTGVGGFDTFGDLGSVYGTAEYGSDFPINADINLIGSGNNVSFSLASNDTNSEYSLQSLVVEYGIGSRR